MKTYQTSLMNQIRRALFHGEIESKENRAPPQVGGGCLANLADASKSKSRRGQRQKWNRQESDRAVSNGISVLADIQAVPQRNSSRVVNSKGGLISLFVSTEKENTHKVKRNRNDSLVISSLLGVESQSQKSSKNGRGRKTQQQVEQVNVSQKAEVSRSDATSLVPKIQSSNVSVLAKEPSINRRQKASVSYAKEDSGSVLVAPPQKLRDSGGWPMASIDSGVMSPSSAASSKALKRKNTRMKSEAIPLNFHDLTTATTKMAEGKDALMTTEDSPESDREIQPAKRKDTRATPSKFTTNEVTLMDLTNAIDLMTLSPSIEEKNTDLAGATDSTAPTLPVEGNKEDLPNAIDLPALSFRMRDEKEHLMNMSDSFSLVPSTKDAKEARINVIDPLAATPPMEDEVDDYTIAIDAPASPAEVRKDDHAIAIDSMASTSRAEDEEGPTKLRTRLQPGSRVFDLEYIPISSSGLPPKEEVTETDSHVILEIEEQEMRRSSRRQAPTDRFSPSNLRRKASDSIAKEDSGSVLVAPPQKSRDNSGWPMASGDSGAVSPSCAASSKALKRKKTRMKSEAIPLNFDDLTTATTKMAEGNDALMTTEDSPESDRETQPAKRKDTRATPSKFTTNEVTLLDLTNAVHSITVSPPMEEKTIVLTNTTDSTAPILPVEGEKEDLPNAIDSSALSSPVRDELEHLINMSDSISLLPSAKDAKEARINVIDPLAATPPMEDEVDDYTIAIDALASPAEVRKDDHAIAIDSMASTSRAEDEEGPTKLRTRLQPGSRVFDLEYIPISSSGSPLNAEVTETDSHVILEIEEQEKRRSSRRQAPTDRFSPSLPMKQAQVKAAKYSPELRDQSVSFSALSQSETETSTAVNKEVIEQVKRRSRRRQIQTNMFSPSTAMKEAQLKVSNSQDEPKRQSSKDETIIFILRKKQRKDRPPKCRRKAAIDAPSPDLNESSSNQSHALDPFEAMQLASPLSYLSRRMQEMQSSCNECQKEETENDSIEKKPSSGSDHSKRIEASHVIMNSKAVSRESLGEVWNEEQFLQLQQWQSQVNPTSSNFWVEISENVDGKSAQECREKWFSLVKTPRAKRAVHKKADSNYPVTAAEPLDTNDEDDIFNSTPLRGTLFHIDTKSLMESEEMRNINLDVGSPVLISARRDRRVSTEYDHVSAWQQKAGYKSYLMGLKQGIARAKRDNKVAKAKQNSAIGTVRNITESVGNGDVSFKCKLSPGGTLEVENLTEVDVEDDFMCCSADFSDCDE